MPLPEYNNEKSDFQKKEFCWQATIPRGVFLEINAFDEFYNSRKALIRDRIRELLM